MPREPKPQTHRNVLFASGRGLVGLGLFPFLQARYSRWVHGLDGGVAVDASSALAAGGRQHEVFWANPVTHTVFDLVTCCFGGAFALFGVGVTFLSCLMLPRRSTCACLKTVGVPLLVVAVGVAMLLLAFNCGAEVAAARRASACESSGAVRDALTLFSALEAWPPVADTHAPIADVCFEAAAAVDTERLAAETVDGARDAGAHPFAVSGRTLRAWRRSSDAADEEEEDASRASQEPVRCVRLLMALVWLSLLALAIMAL
ncbi:hypothetical protein PybrP1_012365 [[Pythium] brassicae (nom. inval.)]|nr:hypothetical protein PybrP1_012365 [[Pythium] brassicae (nom. inval.)]